ncbi:MAG: hypothetical protein AAF500_07430 [Myxococcota bacterium]
MTHTPEAHTHHKVIAHGGPGRFITHLVLEELGGRRLIWHSRRNRKGLDPEPIERHGRTPPAHAFVLRPRVLTWWIGASFMVGAALFAIGSAGILRDARFDGSPVLFVGSLFFTTAAYLQVLEVINEPRHDNGVRPSWSFFRLETEKIGWWAVVVQFAGTLLFNLNTFEGMRSLDPVRTDWWVWSPNAIGSVCFLVASALAYAEVSKSWANWQPRNISWWIVVINLLGSIAFGVSAVTGFVDPKIGEMLDARLSNLTTLIGAVCFFVAAYLLIPEMTARADKSATAQGNP